MTFDEAYEQLNRFDITSVAAQMQTWHPAILGQMILAVQAAKQRRYLGPHPNYAGPLHLCAEREEMPRQWNKRAGEAAIETALKRLEIQGRGGT